MLKLKFLGVNVNNCCIFFNPENVLMISFLFQKANVLDGLGQTGLHRAAKNGLVQICRLLLDAGVDRNVINLKGATARNVASTNVVRLLG